MGAFFLAMTRGGALPSIAPGARAAIARRLQDRSPSPVQTEESDRLLHMRCGQDASCLVSDGVLVLADGRPAIAGTGDSAVPAIVREVARGAMPDLSAVDGSFALCCVRGHRGDATLIRDRFGSRPLVWHDQADCFFAASEVSMLIAAGITAHIDPTVLPEALRYRWVLGASHLLSPFHQVPAAHLTRVAPGGIVETRRYWSIPFVPEQNSPGALDRFVDHTHDAMRRAVLELASHGERVAILLSGGVDSSIIAAVAQEVVPGCKAYVGRLPDGLNNEMERATQVAAHLGMECRIVDVVAPDGEEAVRRMVERLGELPRHPNNLVLEQLYARIGGDADIVLHGDGAEMMFGLADARVVESFRRKQRYLRPVPWLLRRAAARQLDPLPWGRAARLARVLAADPVTFAATLDRIGYTVPVARTLPAATSSRDEPFLPFHHFDEFERFDDALQAYQADTTLIASLVRHDRLAQSHGLVAFSPFLSGAMIDVACRLPRELRYTEFSKPVLRALCDRYFPPHVARWPKMGFEVPWHAWLARLDLSGLTRRAGARLLPPGFLREALRARDVEALWSALVLTLLVESHGVHVSGEDSIDSSSAIVR
jgi:asparagine synthase (glutamine-hydrolysing)